LKIVIHQPVRLTVAARDSHVGWAVESFHRGGVQHTRHDLIRVQARSPENKPEGSTDRLIPSDRCKEKERRLTKLRPFRRRGISEALLRSTKNTNWDLEVGDKVGINRN